MDFMKKMSFFKELKKSKTPLDVPNEALELTNSSFYHFI
jgi:hypothetical protein